MLVPTAPVAVGAVDQARKPYAGPTLGDVLVDVGVRPSAGHLGDLAVAEAGDQDRLLVISFAAYKIPQVLDGLAAAAYRGVIVDIVLETAKDKGGALSFDQLPAFTRLDRVRVWHWPPDKRPQACGSLHAKAIVADDAVALVTSANLTGHALAHNIELGLLVHDRAAASGIAAHVAGLMREGTLARVDA